MRHTGYHLILDNDLRVDVTAASAAQAMQRALEQNPGRTIIKCWSGSYNETVTYTENRKKVVTPPGYIEYEIPAHEPFVPAPKIKATDKTVAMFSDEEMGVKS